MGERRRYCSCLDTSFDSDFLGLLFNWEILPFPVQRDFHESRASLGPAPLIERRRWRRPRPTESCIRPNGR